MTDKTNFLYSEFFTMIFMGTAQRGKVYKETAGETERKTFRTALQQELFALSKQYKAKLSESDHESNIINLAERLTVSYAPILFEGRFRIGSAQKALNLFLKYLWCMGEIEEPPHCPFDFRIIQKLPRGLQDIRWTKLDDIGTYRKLVAAAKACAAPASLPVWELRTWKKL